MSAPIRFLALVLAGWAGVRAVTLGAIPGFTVSYAMERPASALPPIVATQFPPLQPVQAPTLQQPAYYPAYPPMSVPAGYYLPQGYAYPYSAPPRAETQQIPPRAAWHLASSTAPGLAFTSSSASAGDWKISSLPALPVSQSHPIPAFPAQPVVQTRLDRLQMTTWALLR